MVIWRVWRQLWSEIGFRLAVARYQREVAKTTKNSNIPRNENPGKLLEMSEKLIRKKSEQISRLNIQKTTRNEQEIQQNVECTFTILINGKLLEKKRNFDVTLAISLYTCKQSTVLRVLRNSVHHANTCTRVLLRLTK